MRILNLVAIAAISASLSFMAVLTANAFSNNEPINIDTLTVEVAQPTLEAPVESKPRKLVLMASDTSSKFDRNLRARAVQKLQDGLTGDLRKTVVPKPTTIDGADRSTVTGSVKPGGSRVQLEELKILRRTLPTDPVEEKIEPKRLPRIV